VAGQTVKNNLKHLNTPWKFQNLNIWDQHNLEMIRLYTSNRTSLQNSTVSPDFHMSPHQQETSQLCLCLSFYFALILWWASTEHYFTSPAEEMPGSSEVIPEPQEHLVALW